MLCGWLVELKFQDRVSYIYLYSIKVMVWGSNILCLFPLFLILSTHLHVINIFTDRQTMIKRSLMKNKGVKVIFKIMDFSSSTSDFPLLRVSL